jgi:TonB family protein
LILVAPNVQTFRTSPIKFVSIKTTTDGSAIQKFRNQYRLSMIWTGNRLRMPMFLFLAAASAVGAQPNPDVRVDYPRAAAKEGRHGSALIAFDVTASGKVANCRVLRSSGSSDLDAASCSLILDRARYEPSLDSGGSPKAVSTGITVHWIMPGQDQTTADLPIGKADIRVIYLDTNAGPHAGPGRAGGPRKFPVADVPKYPKKAMAAGEQGHVVTLIDVDRKGRPVKCGVIRTSGHKLLDKATCDFALNKLRFEPATDYEGVPTAGRDLFDIHWRL